MPAVQSPSFNFESELDPAKLADSNRLDRIIASPQGVEITLGNGKKVLNFVANNYLGLANNKEMSEAVKRMIDKYGTGMSSSTINGVQDIYRELERKIAEFHGRDAAILYLSCFDANLGLFQALLSEEDAVISDELNHASIIDGIRLCKAKRYRYKWSDMADLEAKLKETSGARLRLIATDGIFSMEGGIANLPEIVRLAKKYDALTFVDDCHGIGVCGATGRGTEEHFNMLGSVDILSNTMGKALGGTTAGYTVAKKSIIDLLKQRSRPYTFTNTIPPPVIATGLKAIEIISKNPDLFKKLRRNTEQFRRGMAEAGFKILGEDHPICPVVFGEEEFAKKVADRLIEKGIYVTAVKFPVVPKKQSRIRVQLSVLHTAENIDKAINAFKEVGREFQIIP